MNDVAYGSPNSEIKIETLRYFKTYRFLALWYRLTVSVGTCIPPPTFNQICWLPYCKMWVCLIIFDCPGKILSFGIFIYLCFSLNNCCVWVLIIASFKFRDVFWQFMEWLFLTKWKSLVKEPCILHGPWHSSWHNAFYIIGTPQKLVVVYWWFTPLCIKSRPDSLIPYTYHHWTTSPPNKTESFLLLRACQAPVLGLFPKWRQ